MAIADGRELLSSAEYKYNNQHCSESFIDAEGLMKNDAMFFSPGDFAVFEPRLASNADYDSERQRVRDKLITLHEQVYPEMRRRKWDVHPHWMSQWLISAWRISPATSRINFMTLRYSKPEALIKLMKKELIDDFGHFYANAMLAARIDDEGFAIELLISEKAWVDGQNLKNRLQDGAKGKETFRSLLAALEGEHALNLAQYVRQDERPVTYQHLLRAKASRLVSPGVLNATMEKYKPGGQDLSLGVRYDPEDRRLASSRIVDEVIDRFGQLYPIYTFLSWSPKNDFRTKQDANKETSRRTR